MNPRGKHFIDAVDPEEHTGDSGAVAAGAEAPRASQAAPVDEAQPVNPFTEESARPAGGNPAPVDSAAADPAAAGSAADAPATAGPAVSDRGEPADADDVEWPSLNEAAPQRRRRSEKSIRRIKRRRRLKVLTIVLVVICAVAAAGVGYVNHSIAQGRAKFEKSTKKAMKTQGETITYNGKKYTLNKHMATIAFIGFDNRANVDGTKKGQSDTVMVIALNTDTGEARGIVIPRDSMVAVDTYANGNFAGQTTEQLCLQFAYGTDGDNSSQLTATAASRVLYNIPVDYYYTLNIEGVAPINDSIGGVTVTPTQAVPGTSIVEGQETTLFGQNAEKYVQWRDTSQLSSSLDRTQRQVSYLKAFAGKVLESAKSNPATLVNLYRAMGDYTWTNLGIDEFSYLATTMLQKGLSSFDLVTLQGEMKQGDQFAEFYLNQDDVYKTVVETFYHPVQ